MNKKISFAAVVLVVVMTVCTVQILRAVDPESKRVNGSGESPGGIVMTVSAVEHTNGDVTGHAMFHDRQTNSKLTIDVTEVIITGNRATIDGEVMRTTGDYATDCEGSHAIFVVEDNGEGNGDPVDRFTLPACYEPGQGVKMAKPFASEMGNLQVRGS